MNNKNILAVMLAAAFAVSGCTQMPQNIETPVDTEQTQVATVNADSDIAPCDTIECSENDSNMLMDELF